MLSTALALLVTLFPQADPVPLADPRPATAVLDTTGTLSFPERRAIDDAANRVRAAGKGEIVVVVVQSIGGADPRTRATKLFNRWRIGDRKRNDGVLLFVALDDHAAELILGSGVDSDAQVAASDAIMQDVMVPRFKAGKPGDAILRGAWAAGERILGVPLGPLDAEAPAEDVEAADEAAPAADVSTPAPAAFATTSEPTGGSSGGPSCLGLGGGGAGLAGLLLGVRAWWRRRPRSCPSCRKPMVRLGEHEDDAHLSPGEQAEERLGSVDYDIWHCAQCNVAVKTRWGTFFTKYGRCPSCSNVTKSSTTTTLQHATEYSGGLVRIDERCDFCSYTRSYTRSTPRIVRSSSSSSSGFFSSRSSGGSSWSGRSSGGGSSGRGSSGRW